MRPSLVQKPFCVLFLLCRTKILALRPSLSSKGQSETSVIRGMKNAKETVVQMEEGPSSSWGMDTDLCYISLNSFAGTKAPTLLGNGNFRLSTKIPEYRL